MAGPAADSDSEVAGRPGLSLSSNGKTDLSQNVALALNLAIVLKYSVLNPFETGVLSATVCTHFNFASNRTLLHLKTPRMIVGRHSPPSLFLISWPLCSRSHGYSDLITCYLSYGRGFSQVKLELPLDYTSHYLCKQVPQLASLPKTIQYDCNLISMLWLSRYNRWLTRIAWRT